MEVCSFKLLSSQYQPHSKSVHMHLKTFLSISRLFIYSNVYIFIYTQHWFCAEANILVSTRIKYTWPFVSDWET